MINKKSVRQDVCSHPMPGKDGTRRRCQSKDFEKCYSCALLYRRDTLDIIFSGITKPDADKFDGKNSGATQKFYFVTLTAPSFGSIHSIKSNGKTCNCGVRHGERDSLLGTAIKTSSKDYDYSGAIQWNFRANELWRETTEKMNRLLPASEWVAVREWQKRGSLHFHVIVRVPENLNDKQVQQALRELKKVKLADGIQWGKQFKVDLVNSEVDKEKTSKYIAKVVHYSAKTLGYSDLVKKDIKRREMLTKLDEFSQRLICNVKGCSGDGTCKGKAHKNLGFTGHTMSTSKNWSYTGLTREKCQDMRIAFAEEAKANALVNGNSGETLEQKYKDAEQFERDMASRYMDELIGEENLFEVNKDIKEKSRNRKEKLVAMQSGYENRAVSWESKNH